MRSNLLGTLVSVVSREGLGRTGAPNEKEQKWLTNPQ